MRLALFSGCRAGFDLPQYEASAKAVLSKIGVTAETLDFNCCGYAVREKDFTASLLLAIRNLAMARAHGLPVLTLCKCCFGSLKQAAFLYERYPSVRRPISRVLRKEGLRYDGGVPVIHLLSFFDRHHDRIKERVTCPQGGVKVAPHYGCHALRPSTVTGFDLPYAPTVFERVLSLTGAEPLAWERRLECCGSPVYEKNPDLSGRFALQKMENARACGADLICSACSHCQIQFDRVQSRGPFSEASRDISSVLVTQLIGVSLGIDCVKLGIEAPVVSMLKAADAYSVG